MQTYFKSDMKTRKQLKARKVRREAAVKQDVRAACVSRDGFCRVVAALLNDYDVRPRGESEWAHMHAKRRSKTRGQDPEERHTTADSLMLCRFHHDAYDGRTRPRLTIEALTDRGADGPLQFTYRGKSYSE